MIRYFLVFGMFFDLYLAVNTGRLGYYALNDQDFFALPACRQPISLTHPDTLLLDAAIFQATNEARRKNGIPILQYDISLYLACSNHARSMIVTRFYDHINPYSAFERTAEKRIELFSKRFKRTGENIGQYQTLETKEWFGVHWNGQKGGYDYFDTEENNKLYQPYTYEAYAHYAVQKWLNSPSHRINLLNDKYTHVGCAARLCPNPYMERRAPFARLVQNFGGEK